MKKVKFYELIPDATVADNKYATPNTWKVRLLLLRKKIPFETIETTLVENSTTLTDRLRKQNNDRNIRSTLPAIDIDGTLICDSFRIADYLEEKFPDAPSVFHHGTAKEVKERGSLNLGKSLARLIDDNKGVYDLYDAILPSFLSKFPPGPNREFFCNDNRHGGPGGFERRVQRHQNEDLIDLSKKHIAPIVALLREHGDFLHGIQPGFGDFVIFGRYAMARNNDTMVSRAAFEDFDPILGNWIQRMLEAFPEVKPNLTWFVRTQSIDFKATLQKPTNKNRKEGKQEKMTIPPVKFYDLVPDIATSDGHYATPNTWKIRLLLLHKRISFETIDMTFIDIQTSLTERLRKQNNDPTAKATVPAIELDDGTIICDSFKIAEFLEEKYPDAPSSFDHGSAKEVKDRGTLALGRRFARLVDTGLGNGAPQWTCLFDAIFPSLLAKFPPGLNRDYFSHESRHGGPGGLQKRIDRSKNEDLIGLSKRNMIPLVTLLKEQGDFFQGQQPGFADFVIFGRYAMARNNDPKVSKAVFEGVDPVVAAWVGRMLEAFPEAQSHLVPY
ncbi:hypothetical protein HDU97_006445 [Phlyctochytrium planicorne]|nr:hypothetical protein HDU97_006445 [Phlyctochytrium planicorne]